MQVPSKRIITHAAMNEHQVAISLSGGEIVYFEMDAMGTLNEYQERMELPAEASQKPRRVGLCGAVV